MFTCMLNDKNRIVAFSESNMFSNVIENPEVMLENPNEPMENFVYADGVIMLSHDTEKEKRDRIAELEKNLADTDYFASQILEEFIDVFGYEPKTLIDVIKVMVDMIRWSSASKLKFGGMIAKRIAWRNELRELEE